MHVHALPSVFGYSLLVLSDHCRLSEEELLAWKDVQRDKQFVRLIPLAILWLFGRSGAGELLRTLNLILIDLKTESKS